VLVIGCGAVSRCLQPLLLRHVDMDFSRLTVIDIDDVSEAIPGTLGAGATFRQFEVTKESFATDALREFVGDGDLLVNLAWNIDAGEIIGWCQHNGVMYLDTSVEEWDPYRDVERPQERTLYHRHMKLREQAATWPGDGPTAVVEHGANPGLVSHWVKRALIEIATAIRDGDDVPDERRAELDRGLAERDFAALAMTTGTKVIHISERDTQISADPKRPGEFVNTWSVDGFHEEGVAPAELGWGTHEDWLPADGFTHTGGPENQIGIARPGIDTLVRSWVPTTGPIIGMIVRHGEAFTISEALTVERDGVAIYRPTVHYAYLPTDVAMASLHECRMSGYELQDAKRIMTDDITEGVDELGVLLLAHDLNGWWVGSQLGIDEARELVPNQNATTLQVAASVLGAIFWMIEHPRRGLCVPDDLDHEAVLAVAEPYLGPCPSVQTDWRPPAAEPDPLAPFREPVAATPWTFREFLVR
jgi:homospermidine synthase